MKKTEITDRSILVVAHPDDEVLWFSSVLEQIEHVVFCFMGVRSSPGLDRRRQEVLSSYPVEHVSSLGLDESEVLNGTDWRNPVVTDFGLKVLVSKYSLPGFSEKLYRHNYSALVTALEHKLAGYKNVFTHNPWGEYGNEEHVQVYRAVSALQDRMGFRLWFSNYCSNKTGNMMAQYVPKLGSSYATFATNKVLAKRIQAIYQKYDCWTWDDDYEWPNHETFLTCNFDGITNAQKYPVFPVNIVSIDLPKEYEQRNRFRRWWNKIIRSR
jgi:LmbE family N-acetylglucosaminyl deacetylase